LLGLSALLPLRAEAQEASRSVADVIAPVLPSVVAISSSRVVEAPAAPLGQAQQVATQTSQMAGSGFIIDPSGIIVTNKHVVNGAYRIMVTLNDGTVLPAEVIGGCPCDMALLRVKADRPLPPVKFGDSDELRIGDEVIAVGNALGLGVAVSNGIVSALNRNIGQGVFDDYIQTDAAINHGNSGGPLFNMKGEVIGIDTAIISPTRGFAGLGYAGPARYVIYVADQILKYGRVHAGWIGLRVQDVNQDMARAVGLEDFRGSAIVTAVDPDSPAAGAKIEEGDIVLQYAGKRFSDIRAFMRGVAMTPIGEATSVVVWRNGAERTVPIKVGEWVDKDATKLVGERPAGFGPPLQGLKLSAITDDLRGKYALGPNQKGVVVADIAAGSPAADSDLTTGDVILKVQHDTVEAPADVEGRLSTLRNQNLGYALMLVQGKDGPRWTTLALGSDAR
jgi:serine protease Do